MMDPRRALSRDEPGFGGSAADPPLREWMSQDPAVTPRTAAPSMVQGGALPRE
jgi:hypothetical protein